MEILGFPCNNFNNQEPGTNKEIQKFARLQGATFRVMGKLECENGKKTHPLFKFLRSTIPTDKNGPGELSISTLSMFILLDIASADCGSFNLFIE